MMSVPSTKPCDPACLAAEVRDLATDAHRTLSLGFVPPPHTRELSRRISHLQTKVSSLAATDLSLWLENLQRQIESRTEDSHRAMTAPPAVEPVSR